MKIYNKILLFVLVAIFIMHSFSVFAQGDIDSAQIENKEVIVSGGVSTLINGDEIAELRVQENILLQEEVLLPQEEKSFITQRIVSLEQDVFSLKVFLGIIAILFGFLLLYIIMVRKKS